MGNPFGRGAARARRELEEALLRIRDRLEYLETAPTSRSTELAIEKYVDTRSGELSRELGKLEKKVADWTLAISEGIERTDRAERRIRAAVQRARKELAKLGYEDPGLEAEAQELHVVDGGGSEDGAVPPLPGGVARTEEASSSIKGVPADILKRKWGM